MIYIQDLQLVLIIPKSIESLLFLLNITLGMFKYRGIEWKDKPQVERSFLIGLIGWFVYITLDIFIYLFAPVSMEGAALGTYMGYSEVYLSLYLVNILRDIALIGAMVQIWGYLIASFTILFGESRSRKLIKNWLFILTMVIISIIIAIFDKIKVTIKPEGPEVRADFSGLGLVVLSFYVSIFLLSAIMLFVSLKSDKRAYESNKMKNHVKSLIIGVFLMGMGNLFWLLIGSYSYLFHPFIVKYNPYIGHSIWMISPIFIYFGLRRFIESSPKVDEDYSEIGQKNFRKLVGEEILGMYLVWNGKIIHTNTMMEKSLKFDKSELSQWSAETLMGHIHPDDLPNIKKQYNFSQVNYKNGNFYEFRFLSKDNTIVWVKQIVYPILDYDIPVYQYIFEVITEKKILQGMLPICSNCKKIRDDAGSYVQMEKYIQDHSDALFTHGLCPDCMKDLYGEAFDKG